MLFPDGAVGQRGREPAQDLFDVGGESAGPAEPRNGVDPRWSPRPSPTQRHGRDRRARRTAGTTISFRSRMSVRWVVVRLYMKNDARTNVQSKPDARNQSSTLACGTTLLC